MSEKFLMEEWMSMRLPNHSYSKVNYIIYDIMLDAPGRRQVIISTNAGILWIGVIWTYFNVVLIEIHIFSFKKIHLKMSYEKWRPFCLGVNVLIPYQRTLR